MLEHAYLQAGEVFEVVTYIAEGEYRGRFLHRTVSGETRLIERPNGIENSPWTVRRLFSGCMAQSTAWTPSVTAS